MYKRWRRQIIISRLKSVYEKWLSLLANYFLLWLTNSLLLWGICFSCDELLFLTRGPICFQCNDLVFDVRDLFLLWPICLLMCMTILFLIWGVCFCCRGFTFAVRDLFLMWLICFLICRICFLWDDFDFDSVLRDLFLMCQFCFFFSFLFLSLIWVCFCCD